MVRFRLLKSKWRKKDRTVKYPSAVGTEEHGQYSEIVTTRDYQGTQGKMMIPEHGLLKKEKLDLEKKISESHHGELQEKTWEKTAKENLDEIRTLIDKDKLPKITKKNVEKKEIPQESILKTEDLAPELIKGNIIDREIIYETSGGYVVKVTYRDNGQVETDYYSVSKIYDVEHTLDTIQSYKPIIQEKKPEIKEQKDKDSFLKKSLGKLKI
jgi:hypothetical protein